MMSKKMVMRGRGGGGGECHIDSFTNLFIFFYSNMLLRTRPTELQPGYHVKDNKKGSEKNHLTRPTHSESDA